MGKRLKRRRRAVARAMVAIRIIVDAGAAAASEACVCRACRAAPKHPGRELCGDCLAVIA